MMKTLLLMALVNVSTLVGLNAARADGLLQFEGNLLKWGVAPSQLTTVITYAKLTAPFTVPKDKSILSPDNCGAMTSFANIAATTSGVSEDQVKQQLEAAFATWEAVADIRFVEVADTHEANIIVGATNGHGGKAFANLSYRSDRTTEPIFKALGKTGPEHSGELRTAFKDGAVLAIEQAYVCLNSASPWKVGFDGNLDVYDLRYTFTHEIGHTIGLDHPGNSSSGSIMAYRYDERVEQLQPSDISAVQKLYGKNRPKR